MGFDIVVLFFFFKCRLEYSDILNNERDEY